MYLIADFRVRGLYGIGLNMSFLLIDANNYFSRFYFGGKDRVIDIYLNFLKKALKFFNATHYCNVIDAERSFRYNIYDKYKANREEKPKEYHDFFECLKNNFIKLGINYISSKTLEAEDSCNLFVKNNSSINFTVLSGDKDCLLILDSPNVEIWDYKETEFKKRDFIKYEIFNNN
jgi:5'-3' exonuclease